MPANAALDTNFYTELHEERFEPASPAEAQEITADQSVVSLAEIGIHAGPEGLDRYERALRAEIGSLARTGTSADTIQQLQDRLTTRLATARARIAEISAPPPPGTATPLDRARKDLGVLLADPQISKRDIRNKMADIKLLEPDAYGSRSAVRDVVLGGQVMAGKSKTKRKGAAADVGARRLGENSSSAYASVAGKHQAAEAVLGHLLAHTPLDPTRQQEALLDRALIDWANNAEVRKWASQAGEVMKTPAGRRQGFVAWAQTTAIDSARQLAVSADLAAIHEGAPVGRNSPPVVGPAPKD